MLQSIHATLRVTPAGGHSMTQVIEAIEKAGLLKSGGADFTNTLIPLDRQTNFSNIYYGGIVIATRYQDDVAYYAYCMAATNPQPLGAQTINGSNNSQLQVLVQPERVIDATFHNTTGVVVAAAFHDQPTLHATGAAVIQDTFNPNDQQALGQLVAMAITQNLMKLHRLNKVEHSFSLKELLDKKYGLKLSVEPCGPITLLDGTPVNATQKIVISARPNARQETSDRLQINSTNVEMVLANVFTYTELVERAPVMIQAPNGAMIPSTQRMQPRIHISHVEQVNKAGLSLLPLAVWATMQLIPNKLWAMPFCPTRGRDGGPELRDIGVINMITNYVEGGGIIQTADPNFTIAWLSKMLDDTVVQEPYICFDLIGGAAEQAWMQALNTASQNDDASITELWSAMNLLTDGKMSELTNGARTNMTVVGGTRGAAELEYGGYYTDRAGQRRPLTELDMLAIGVLSNGDVQAVRNWQETTVACTALHPLERAIRRHQLRTQFANSATANSYIRTVTVPGSVAQQLSQAVAKTGVDVIMMSPPNLFVGQVQSYVFNGAMTQHAISPAAVTTFYQTTQGAAAYNNLVV